jgi:thiol:disulfide interchange protein DsbD
VKRLSILVPLLAVAVLLGMQPVLGASPYGKFLPPDQAFQLNAQPRGQSIVLDWTIHDGYYLYRKHFKIKADSGKIGQTQFPPGEEENDPNFGKVEVYRREVRVAVPVRKVPSSGKLALTVVYQGCADAGLCYAPITKHVTVQMGGNQAALAGGGSTAGGAGAGGGGSAAAQSEQGHLASLVEHANPIWFVLVFFGLGVLLAFTPCVLPMVPILAGILGKSGERGGARRGFVLSLVYVLAMAVVYTAAGVAAGFIGVGLQGFFQTPWIIGLIAAVFVALALSLFGLYELRLPAGVTARLTAASGRTRGGSFAGAAGMGVVAALVVSPCVAAPIAGALIAIGQAGVPARGGLALAALSLGMGAPLVVYGTVAGRFLPRAGRWMMVIERLLGVAMLAYAAWLLGRVLPAPVVLVLYGAIGLLTAVMLGVFKRPLVRREHGFIRGAGLVAGLAGLVLIVGGAGGGTNPLLPFAGLRAMPPAEAMTLEHHPVESVAALRTQLARASAADQPVMVDFYADWCTSCVEMEHTTLRNAKVRSALRKFRILRVDVTANTHAERALLKRFDLYGPPAYLFFGRNGRHLTGANVVGFMRSAPFLNRLRRALNTASPERAKADGA